MKSRRYVNEEISCPGLNIKRDVDVFFAALYNMMRQFYKLRGDTVRLNQATVSQLC